MAQSATSKIGTQLHERPVSTPVRKPPGSEKELLNALIQDVVNAATLRNEAVEAFNSAISQFPSGLPHPDGSQVVKNTSVRLSIARKKLMSAHNRLDDFRNKGIVPEDLKRGGWALARIWDEPPDADEGAVLVSRAKKKS